MVARAYNDFMVASHFSLREFECRCCRRVQLATRLVLLLEDLRTHWGRPVVITSGYRCEERNKIVGGSVNSLHRHGQAVDIAADVKEQQKLLGMAHFLGFEEIIPGGAKNYLHLGLKTLVL